jgi:hypothetical protein
MGLLHGWPFSAATAAGQQEHKVEEAGAGWGVVWGAGGGVVKWDGYAAADDCEVPHAAVSLKTPQQFCRKPYFSAGLTCLCEST